MDESFERNLRGLRGRRAGRRPFWSLETGDRRSQSNTSARGNPSTRRVGHPARGLWRETSNRQRDNPFWVSSDGTEFKYPASWQIESDSSLVKRYRDNLRCIGWYSEDTERNFSNDSSSLSFLNIDYLPERLKKEKSVHLDLTVSEDQTIDYSGSAKKTFENFLSWILSSEKKVFVDDDVSEVKPAKGDGGNFIFLKNGISAVFRIPFTFRNEVSFYAVCIDGNIYILRTLTDDSERDSPDVKKIHLWSHKFEQYLVSGENVKEGLNCNSDYRCVLTSNLGSHTLLFSSSVDSFNPDLYDEEGTDLTAAVFVKCIFDNPVNREKKYLERFKMLRFCIELMLTGVPEVLVGFRDSEGMVEKLKLYDVNDLMREGKEYWDPNVCFTFVNQLLSLVKNRTEAKPNIIHFFKKEDSSSLIKVTEHDGQEFPPQWFLDEFKTRS